SVIRIDLPALRERPGDIATLADYFLNLLSREHKVRPKRITEEALAALRNYSWPGNVRELRNAVSQAVVLTRNGVIDSEHLPEKLTMGMSAQSPSGTAGAACNVGIPGDSTMVTKPSLGTRISLSLDDGLNNMVQQIMQKAVEVCGGNVTLAAQILGISRKTIYNRLRLDSKPGAAPDKSDPALEAVKPNKTALW
ncbi:MAG TPA: helix-turn-helix domain-containing protein, partial [Planctomycetota bacterium]|nr:helix-turn-helix domain-containing protein [Planctomycetota bacterium]